MEYSYIANSGIQLLSFPIEIDSQDIFKKWFREWYDKEQGIYQKYARELIDKGEAYYCFCDKDRLESLKQTVSGQRMSLLPLCTSRLRITSPVSPSVSSMP